MSKHPSVESSTCANTRLWECLLGFILMCWKAYQYKCPSVWMSVHLSTGLFVWKFIFVFPNVHMPICMCVQMTILLNMSVFMFVLLWTMYYIIHLLECSFFGVFICPDVHHTNVSVYSDIHFSGHLSFRPSICWNMSVWTPVYLSECPTLWMSIHLPECLSEHMSVWMVPIWKVHLYKHLPFCLNTHGSKSSCVRKCLAHSHLSEHIYLSECLLNVHMLKGLFMWMSEQSSPWTSICTDIHLNMFVCINICPCICTSVCENNCLPKHLSICLIKNSLPQIMQKSNSPNYNSIASSLFLGW